MNEKSLKIVRLEASNIKRLKAVEIIPNGNTVTITGKNDQGKTSVLDAITYALAGKDSVCERPIREGTSKAQIVCDLHDLVVTRKFTAAGGSTLTVTTKDGLPMKSPQAVLDSLCSHIAFDPLSFVRLKPAEQKETLRKLVGLDFTELDATKQSAYVERTVANRELATAKAKLQAYPPVDAPAEEVKVSDLMAQLQEVRDHNAANKEIKERWEEMGQSVIATKSAVSKVNMEIEELHHMIAQKEAYRNELLDRLSAEEQSLSKREEAVKDLVYKDEQPILDKINEADEVNSKVRAARRRKEIQAEVRKVEEKVEKLTTTIEEVDQKKAKALSEAEFPLPGLSFDESGVLLNGVPFSQGSQARQLQAAVAIGLALNPKVRVILVRDASLLDDDSMKLVAEMAEKHDAQVWLEVVNSKAPGAIVIEDGQIKE